MHANLDMITKDKKQLTQKKKKLIHFINFKINVTWVTFFYKQEKNNKFFKNRQIDNKPLTFLLTLIRTVK